MQRAIPTLEISPAFEAVVLKALAQDPERRHASAQALLADLEAAEDSSLRASPLPRDPLSWGGPAGGLRGAVADRGLTRRHGSGPRWVHLWFGRGSTASDRATRQRVVAGVAARAAPGCRGPSGRPAIALRATVALVLTTAVVRAAWSLVA
jgi:hypothetical protein